MAASVSFGESKPLPVVLQLDWVLNAQFAGVYQAVEQGYYEEAGMEVEIRPVPKDDFSVEVVVADPAPYIFGVAESNVLIQAHAGGAPIKALATMFQDSPMGWMSLASSGIEKIADFKGKRVGVHTDGEKPLELALAQFDLNRSEMEIVHVGWDPAILVKGEVDVMQGYYIDEFVRLQLLTGGKGNFLLARDYGYLAYSQVIFATEKMIEDHSDVVKRFLQATKKGWEYALDHVEDTADLIIAKYSPHLDRDYQLASLRRIADLVSPDGQLPLHPMEPAKWKASQEKFLKIGILKAPADLDVLLDFHAEQ